MLMQHNDLNLKYGINIFLAETQRRKGFSIESASLLNLIVSVYSKRLLIVSALGRQAYLG